MQSCAPPKQLLSLPIEVLETIFVYAAYDYEQHLPHTPARPRSFQLGDACSPSPFAMYALSRTCRLFRHISQNNHVRSRILMLKHAVTQQSPATLWAWVVQDVSFDADIALQLLATYPSVAYINVLCEYVTLSGHEHVLVEILDHYSHLLSPQTVNDTLVQASIYSLSSFLDLLLPLANVHHDGDAAICMAAKYGSVECVRLLLEAGADVHAQEDYPLLWACRNGHKDVVELLIEHNATVTSRNGSPLNFAAEQGHTEIVRLLIDKGADVHSQEDYPLRWSAVRGHADMVKMLCSEYGADVHAMNDFALRNSVKLKHISVVKVLLEYGADPMAFDSESLQVAITDNHQELISLLSKYAQ